MNSVLSNVGTVKDLTGESFIVEEATTLVKVVAEKMRDQKCLVAVITKDSKLAGLVDSALISQLILEGGSAWEKTAGDVAKEAATLAGDSDFSALNGQIAKSGRAIVLNSGGGIQAVHSAASVIRNLNSRLNTRFHQAAPFCESRATVTAL